MTGVTKIMCHINNKEVVVLFESNDVGITLSRVFKVKFKSSDRNIIVVVKDRKPLVPLPVYFYGKAFYYFSMKFDLRKDNR